MKILLFASALNFPQVHRMMSSEDLQYSLLQQEDGKLYLDFPRFVSGKHLTNTYNTDFFLYVICYIFMTKGIIYVLETLVIVI